jgi:Ca2+-binding EF-hand superfamily protein
MKKLMLGLSVAALAITVSAPSFAREVKQVVGYVKTEKTYNDRDVEFHKVDTSGDGAINFKEFQNGSILENEYELFNMNDTNNDDLLTIDEFRVFSKQGPARVAGGPSMTNYNFNKKGTHY